MHYRQLTGSGEIVVLGEFTIEQTRCQAKNHISQRGEIQSSHRRILSIYAARRPRGFQPAVGLPVRPKPYRLNKYVVSRSSSSYGDVTESGTVPYSGPVSVITAEELTKRYGQLAAVDGVTFGVDANESFGLLGPNGAGKSTAMRMIGAVTARTSGTLSVLGYDPDTHGPEVRAHLGVIPQEDNLDEELRVRDNLITYGRYFGLPLKYLRAKADDLLESPQLTHRATARVDTLSGGM